MNQEYQLWKDSFGDTDPFMEYYFSERADEGDKYCQYDGGKLASILYVNPIKIHVNENLIETGYIVGVATHKEYRRQGLMEQNMEQVLSDFREKNVPFVLLMAEHQEYYEKFGFKKVFTQRYKVLPVARVPRKAAVSLFAPLSTVNVKETVAFAKKYLRETYKTYVEHDEEYLFRMQKEYKTSDGNLLVYRKQGKIAGYLLYGIEDEKIVLMEASFAEEEEKWMTEWKKYLGIDGIEIKEHKIYHDTMFPIMAKAMTDEILVQDPMLFFDWV